VIDFVFHFSKRKTVVRTLPSSWDDLDGALFLKVCAFRLAASKGDVVAMDEALRRLCGLRSGLWRKLSPLRRNEVESCFSWVLFDQPSFPDNKVGDIRVGFRRLCGFERNFENVLWEEFMYADVLFSRGKYDRAVASVYRPVCLFAKGDSRKPFSVYCLSSSLRRVGRLPDLLLYAVALNWSAVRTHCIVSRYRSLFGGHVEAWLDGKKIEDDSPKAANAGFSWNSLHLAMLGDSPQSERMLMETKACTVLAVADRRIREYRDQARRMRK